MDWDDLRIFLAVARNGSLAGAAKELRVTQSTVSRRTAALQAKVGSRLLHRTAEGFELTMSGQAIFEQVERMECAAQSVQRTIGGHDPQVGGVVRLSSSHLLTCHVLAPCLAALHARHHAVMVELVPAMPCDTLAAREIDLAVRMRQFENRDLLVRKLGSVTFGLYGSVQYLAHRGEPEIGDRCAGHHLVAALDDGKLTTQAAWLSEHGSRAEVFLRSDCYEIQQAAVAGGGGLAVLPRFLANADPDLRELCAPNPVPSAEIWMAVHQESRNAPNIRAVLNCVADAVRVRSSLLNQPMSGVAGKPKVYPS